MSSINPPREPVNVLLTPLMMRAAELRESLAGMEPGAATSAHDDSRARLSAVDMLSRGTELGLWNFRAQDGAGNYLIEINGRAVTLRLREVHGWVLGVLHALSLPVGPFAYREGL